MLAFCRDLDVQYKTAFVLAHKLREAMTAATKALRIGGDGRTAEIDGAWFGGHVRPQNPAIHRLHPRAGGEHAGPAPAGRCLRGGGGGRGFSPGGGAVAA